MHNNNIMDTLSFVVTNKLIYFICVNFKKKALNEESSLEESNEVNGYYHKKEL